MLSIKQAKSRRSLLSPLFPLTTTTTTTTTTAASPPPPPTPTAVHHSVVSYFHTSSLSTTRDINFRPPLDPTQVLDSVKQWFKSQTDATLDQIFAILSSRDDVDAAALSSLGLRLSESLVLDVFSYGKSRDDVLSCVKFFDWAGRQPGFFHTRATYYGMFNLLSRAKLVHVLNDYLDSRERLGDYVCGFGFYNILVLGYAMAGKVRVALQLFGKMRFHGNDLDPFVCHVLLNASIEEGLFDVADAVSRQIGIRGYERGATHGFVLKSLCMRKRFDEAEAYLRRRLVDRDRDGLGYGLGYLVAGLCENGGLDEAGKLVSEFEGLGVLPMGPAYGAWLKALVGAGEVSRALEFIQKKKSVEGYVPDVFRCNMLLHKLLRQNRLMEVYDLLVEMQDLLISPDKVTMNAVLCFFCKAGLVNIALELYNSKSEFGLSPNSMVFNYLINSLCGDGSVDEAYRLLRNSTGQGCLPGRKATCILAQALWREGKLDKMKELIRIAAERNWQLSDYIFEMYISAFCRARRVEDGYFILEDLNRMNKIATQSTYLKLIHGFNQSNKGNYAVKLLIEMQEKGYKVSLSLLRAVISCLANLENPEMHILKLLDVQLSLDGSKREVYNNFIDGVGRIKMPELANKVYEMMERSGIKPNLDSDLLLLRSYLKSEKIYDAQNFYDSLLERRERGRKLGHVMINGLCRVKKKDLALEVYREIRGRGQVPGNQSYENLVQLLCSSKDFDVALDLINDLLKNGRLFTSFLGNVLLLHSLRTEELYNAWLQYKEQQNEISSGFSVLGQLIGAFSGHIRVSQEIDDIEELIQQCFPLSIYTYNLLLRRACKTDLDLAYMLFNRMCQKGYKPNAWTYDILVRAHSMLGRHADAKTWLMKMLSQGFNPSSYTLRLV